MYAYELGIFEEQCHALAEAVRARGAILRKLPEHEIAIDVRGESVAFPVASDERDWLLTTPEEAFYAAMLDAEFSARFRRTARPRPVEITAAEYWRSPICSAGKPRSCKCCGRVDFCPRRRAASAAERITLLRVA